MKLKNFLIAGIAGGIVDFLLGGVFYGMIFPNIYPQNENTNMSFILLGCMTFGFLLSYLFTHLAGITKALTGLIAGGIIGFLNGLSMNFFMYSGMALNVQNMITDVAVCIILGAGVGITVALVNGKLG